MMNESDWETLRQFSQSSAWRATPFLVLGASDECEEKWYSSDPVTKPSDYDQFDYRELCALKGMGTVRLRKIHNILSMLVGDDDFGESDWETLRRFSQGAAWRATPFLVLGASDECEEKWYASDPVTKPSDYDQFDYGELCALRGMGTVRLRKIHNILSMLVGDEDLGHSSKIEAREPSVPVGVPQNWPIALIPLSARSRKIFNQAEVVTVGDLVDAFLDNGLFSNLQAGGIGKKTIEQIEKLRMDLTIRELRNLREWFPLSEKGDELSLGVALAKVTEELSEEDAKVLKPRLLDGKTLEEAAQVGGKTRERVRQIESNYLASLRLLLEQFPENKKELFEAWRRSADLGEALGPDWSEVTLALHGIAACFKSSDEGKAFKAETTEKTNFLLSEVEKQSEYWLGELNLEDFTAQLESMDFFHALVTEVRKKSKYEYDPESKALRPTGVSLKKAAVAYLSCAEGPCEAKDLLNYLKTVSPFSGPASISELRNAYWNRWKNEAGFEGFEVRFPNLHAGRPSQNPDFSHIAPALGDSNNEEEETHEEVYHESPGSFENDDEFSAVSFQDDPDEETDDEPFLPLEISPERERLRELNAKILGLRSEVDGEALLGLLPVEEFEQEELLSSLKEEASGDHRRLRRYLELFPGATAYACSLIVSKWYEGGSCWPIFSREEGLAVPIVNAVQGPFTDRFKSVCKRTLDLSVPEEGESAGRVDALLTQAAIVKQWVPFLANAVRAAEREFILPDPEDEHGLEHFSAFLAEKVPQAQARLVRFLSGSSGVLLARALAVSVHRGNFENLPVHMREQMKNALENAGGSQMKGPFLRLGWVLDFSGKEIPRLFLVLPSQRGKITTDHTQWKVENDEVVEDRSSAVEEREVPAARGENKISLLNPNRGTDREWTFQGSLSSEEPFFVFDADTGRKRKKITFYQEGSTRRAKLPAGAYEILAHPDAQVITQDGTEVAGDDPWRIELEPREPPTEFVYDDKKWVFEAERKPGMRLNFPLGKELHTEAGRKIRYGDLLDCEIWVPQKNREETLEVSVKTLQSGQTLSERPFEVPLQFGETGFAFANLKVHLSVFLDEIPAGIHEVAVDYGTDSCRGTPYRFHYWKGLLYDGDGIFNCSDLPADFDSQTWRGLEASGTDLRYKQDRGGPVVQIICGGESDDLRKDGVFVSLNEKNGESRYLRSEDPPLAIQETDDRYLVFETSNPGKWLVSIRASEIDGERGFLDFTERRMSRKVRLGSVLAAYGQSGQIFQKARNEHLSGKPLFSYGKRVVGRKFKPRQSETDSSRFEVSFRFPMDEFEKIRIVGRNLLAERNEDEVIFESEEIGFAEYGKFWQNPQLGYLTLSMEERTERDEWKIVFSWPIGMPEPSLYFFEVLGKKEEGDEFEMLELDDHPYPSNARFFAGPNQLDPCSEEDGPWKRLLSAVRHYDQEFTEEAFLSQLSFEEFRPEEIERWFGRFRKLLLFKYHHFVWERVNWLQNAFFFFCRQAFKQDCTARKDAFARNAVLGLMERAEERESLSLISSLTFGQNPRILALPADAFVPVADQFSSDTPVESSYVALGKLNQTERISEALDFGSRIRDFTNLRPLGLFRGFANFTSASSGHEEFRGFDWDSILTNQHAQTQGEGEIAGSLSRFWEDVMEAESENNLFGSDTIPLSPHHCAVALKRLRRRVNRIQSGQIEGFLADQRSSLTRAHENGERIMEPIMKRKVGIPNFKDLRLPLSGLLTHSDTQTRELFEKAGHLLFLLAGWASLKGTKVLDQEEYEQKLSEWFGVSGETADDPLLARRICLLLSLGPEWFAFLRLLWEIVLRTR